jgi:Domain of unknown function (DUF4134)
MRRKSDKIFVWGAMLEAALLLSIYANAQDANQAITNATTAVAGYYKTAVTLLYAIGGVIGLIGAIRVYSMWSHGDPMTGKVAAAWFGACIFLVLVATVINAFFGLSS